MIAANELRIGNYIQLFRKAEDKEMTCSKIKSIYFDDDEQKYFAELEDGFWVNIDAGIEPITITENIILECGFRFETYTGEEEIDYYILEDSEFILDASFQPVEYGSSIHIMDYEIKYIHQLQNIYFDFTQKELTRINVKKDIWFIDASNIQKEMLQRFIEKYGWEQFEYGCYFEHDSVTLALQTFGKPDVLEVQLRQSVPLELGGRIVSNCPISLHGNDIDIFTKNLFYAIIHLKDKILANCENNEDVSISLNSFMGYLKTNLVI